MRLTPHDQALQREVEQIGRPLWKPRLPDPQVHLTAVIPGRKRRRPPPPPELTDPYCAIFDILDADRAQ